jgi:hypothetical protein
MSEKAKVVLTLRLPYVHPIRSSYTGVAGCPVQSGKRVTNKG